MYFDKGEVEWILKFMKWDFGGIFDIMYDIGGDEMDGGWLFVLLSFGVFGIEVRGRFG